MRKTLSKNRAVSNVETSCESCLLQADICCEQARAAARLKRLDAACGLFSTAQSLLLRAINSSGEACSEACNEARERLNSISAEMAAYCELAKSAARPMNASSTKPSFSRPSGAPALVPVAVRFSAHVRRRS